jgi:hypothetical protein
MKYIKENLTLVIVGAVVLLLMVATFGYPLPQWKDDLRARMDEKAKQAQAIRDMASKAIELPGAQTQKGVPNADWVEEKKKVIESSNNARTKVSEEARRDNQKSRVNDRNEPLLPIPRSVDLSQVGVALVDSTTQKPILPHSNDPMEFKNNYQRVFRIWTNLLAAGTLTDTGPAPSTPPKLEDLQQLYAAQLAAEIANLPKQNGVPVAGGGGAAPLTNRKFYEFAKGAVMNRAAGLQMYIEPSPIGFQIRDWAFHDQPPTDEQIFDGLVDLWIQADIVKAITQINNKAMGVGPDRNVGKAAIKRLTRIIIGNNARTRQLGGTTPGAGGMPVAGANAQIQDPGALFFSSTNASSTGGGGSPVPVNPGGAPAQAQSNAPDNTISYDLSMTGRSAGGQYDIVHVSILVDIDPAQLNGFEKALYMQNMGYTVEGEQTRTVDPLDRASNGYLYGDGQVVEAEIQVEALLFRSWTAALIRQQLGVPAPAPAGGAKAPGQ